MKNREIKFRVFDKKLGKFFYIQFDQNPKYWAGYIKDGLDYQQWTGLKDKNGAEIYEGDILKHESGHITLIEWSEGDWGWFMRTIKKWSPKTYFNSDKDEVIGNIYEHSNLLEEPKK